MPGRRDRVGALAEFHRPSSPQPFLATDRSMELDARDREIPHAPALRLVRWGRDGPAILWHRLTGDHVEISGAEPTLRFEGGCGIVQYVDEDGAHSAIVANELLGLSLHEEVTECGGNGKTYLYDKVSGKSVYTDNFDSEVKVQALNAEVFGRRLAACVARCTLARPHLVVCGILFASLGCSLRCGRAPTTAGSAEVAIVGRRIRLRQQRCAHPALEQVDHG